MNYRLDDSDDDEPQPRVPLGDADDAAAAKVRYEAACKDKTKQAMAEADAARPPKISEQAAREFMAAKPTKFSYAARGGAGDSGNADALFVLDVPKKYLDSNSDIYYFAHDPTKYLQMREEPPEGADGSQSGWEVHSPQGKGK